jgi:uncharacterized protein
MMRRILHVFFLFSLYPCSICFLLLSGLMLTGLNHAEAADHPAMGYSTIEWTDLLPPDDLKALENRPEFIDNIEEGSSADDLANASSQLTVEQSAAWQRYEAALTSTRTRPEFEGRQVRIPGFVVPLDFDEQQKVSEFFLVPFFGACIHVPPPPPNQIIHIQLSTPYQMESIYDPVWLTGTLHLETTSKDIGESSYSLKVNNIKPYIE